MGFISQMLEIVRKDLVVEWRTKEVLAAMLVFGLLTVLIFNFALDLRAENVALVAPGILWVAFTFAGTLGLNRLMSIEKDQGCMDGLLLCPVDRTALYLGKMIGSFVLMVVAEVVILPVFAALFDLPLLTPAIVLVVLLGTLGFAAVGTLFSAVAVNTRAREVMLPVLLLPVVIPVILASVKSIGIVLDGSGTADLQSWMQMLAVFDVVFLALGALVFEFAVEE
jgi:heme exporter protein B